MPQKYTVMTMNGNVANVIKQIKQSPGMHHTETSTDNSAPGSIYTYGISPSKFYANSNSLFLNKNTHIKNSAR